MNEHYWNERKFGVSKLKKENYDLLSKSPPHGIEHQMESDSAAAYYDHKVLDVAPIYHISNHHLSMINEFSDGRDTDGVFFKPNLSIDTQQSLPPSVLFTAGSFENQADSSPKRIQSNRECLKRLYLQANLLYQEKQRNPQMKTYQDEPNLHSLLNEHHPNFSSGEVSYFSFQIYLELLSQVPLTYHQLMFINSVTPA